MKKILFGLLILSILFLSVSAAENYIYTGTELTKYSSSASGTVCTPDNLNSVGSWAFFDCPFITKVVINDNVTKLGSNVFVGCSFLKNVVIGAGVSEIGNGVFYDCPSLSSITVSSSNNYFTDYNGILTDIAKTQLIRCPTKFKETVILPSSLRSIDETAFYNCSDITDIYIPKSLLSIGRDAFSGCSSLTDIYYAGSEEDFKYVYIGSGNDSLTDAHIHFNFIDTDTACITNNSELSLTVTLSSPDISGQVIAAAYDADNKISDIKVSDISGQTSVNININNENIDHLRIFTLNILTPMSYYEEIRLNQ